MITTCCLSFCDPEISDGHFETLELSDISEYSREKRQFIEVVGLFILV
jgi:hypothetical protein